MSVVVFCGPTLSAADVREQIDAVCLPPAGHGDILRASGDVPEVAGVLQSSTAFSELFQPCGTRRSSGLCTMACMYSGRPAWARCGQPNSATSAWSASDPSSPITVQAGSRTMMRWPWSMGRPNSASCHSAKRWSTSGRRSMRLFADGVIGRSIGKPMS